MPGWQNDRPPPLVLTGSAPPGAMRPPSNERAALALGAKAQVFEEQDRVDREGVVELDDVDVGRLMPACAKARRASLGDARDREVGMPAISRCVVLVRGAQQVGRALAQIARPVGARHTTAAAPSVTRQQSRTLNGSATMRAPR